MADEMKYIEWLKKLYVKTKQVALAYTGIFIIVMFLNQLLFFGLCLNPICLVAAMPHVLFITILIGTWWYRPNWRDLRKKLISVRETYSEVKENIKRHQKNDVEKIFSGNIFLFVTHHKSQGEEDFKAILSRHLKPNISLVIRMNNHHKSKALLTAIKGAKHSFQAGDIVAIVRGGGNTDTEQFDSYRDEETCDEVRSLYDNLGVITISGIGHSTDSFPIEKAVNLAQITPTDAANQAVSIIAGGKW